MKRTALIMLCVVLLVFVSCAKDKNPFTASELLDLGEKHLLELNYEQAIVMFTRLIEVEPMNARAYSGLAEAYLGAGEMDKAVAALQKGQEQTGDAGIEAMLKVFLEEGGEKNASPPAGVATATLGPAYIPPIFRDPSMLQNDPVAKQLFDCMQAGDIEGAGSIFISVNYSHFDNHDVETQGSSYGERNEYGLLHGMGIAYFPSDGYVYYGEWVNGIREGEGVWFEANDLFTDSFHWYSFSGPWENDLPNGYFECRCKTFYEDPFASSMQETMMVNVINGIFHGEAIVTRVDTRVLSDAPHITVTNTTEYSFSYENGMGIPIGNDAYGEYIAISINRTEYNPEEDPCYYNQEWEWIEYFPPFYGEGIRPFYYASYRLGR